MVIPVVRREAARAYLAVALGGSIGAISRYLVTVATGDAAFGTFLANISGALLLGFFATLAGERVSLPLDVRRFVTIGILGSYTTFSTLSHQTLEMIENGNLAGAAANSIGSLIMGLAAVAAGVSLARTRFRGKK